MTTRGDHEALTVEQQLAILQQKLVQAQRLTALGELVSTTTHEFNNVLMTILNYAKMGLRHKDEATRDKAFQKVLAAAERASKITNSVLGMARNRSESFEPTDLAKLIDESLVLLERELRKYRISVETHFAPVPAACAVGNQIQQVVLNLLINARQAMPDGGRLIIRLEHSADGDTVDLTIRDTGCGIPADKLPRIFDPFYSTKQGPDSSGKGGTGLGLSRAWFVRLPSHHRVPPGPRPRREHGRRRYRIYDPFARLPRPAGRRSQPAGIAGSLRQPGLKIPQQTLFQRNVATEGNPARCDGGHLLRFLQAAGPGTVVAHWRPFDRRMLRLIQRLQFFLDHQINQKATIGRDHAHGGAAPQRLQRRMPFLETVSRVLAPRLQDRRTIGRERLDATLEDQIADHADTLLALDLEVIVQNVQQLYPQHLGVAHRNEQRIRQRRFMARMLTDHPAFPREVTACRT